MLSYTKKINIFCFLFLLIHATASYAEPRKHYETYYQRHWCDNMNGISEYRLPDHTRIDCLTKNFVIEVDFANKWQEAIGQSLYYQMRMNEVDKKGKRNAGILLIKESETDRKYHKRLLDVIKHYHLKIFVWTVTPDMIEELKQ